MSDHRAAPAIMATNSPGIAPAAQRANVRGWCELTAPLTAGDHAAIGALRHLAQSALSAWGITRDQADDVIVVLSELTTNALLHTDGPARVRMRIHADRLVMDVTDTSPRLPDFGTGPDDDTEQPHGYGLALIAAHLADSLTVDQHPECGKTVTAVFAIKCAEAHR